MPRRAAAHVIVSVIVTVSMLGCGSASRRAATQSDDSERAQRIRESAEERQAETPTVTTADQLAPSVPAKRKLPPAAELPSTVDLPAGSEEIDGAGKPPTSPSSSATTRILSANDRASFARLAASLPGSEGLAVAGLGRRGEVEPLGRLRSGVAWSTAKLPVAMAAITAGTAAQADLVQAITASDNAAAERLWASLGDSASAADQATEAVRSSGDRTTTIQAERLRPGFTAFGQTAWALTDQARFVAGMSCAPAGPEVLGFMNRVVAGQRWGLGATGLDAQFKGGWGPGVAPGADDGWLDRQVGIVTIDGRPLAVAIASTAPSHAAGTAALTRLARWVVDHAETRALPTRPRC